MTWANLIPEKMRVSFLVVYLEVRLINVTIKTEQNCIEFRCKSG